MYNVTVTVIRFYVVKNCTVLVGKVLSDYECIPVLLLAGTPTRGVFPVRECGHSDIVYTNKYEVCNITFIILVCVPRFCVVSTLCIRYVHGI